MSVSANLHPCVYVRLFQVVGDLRNGPCTTSNSLATALAVPDADGVSLDSVLSAECADVSGVLCDFHLLHLFSERCTVSMKVVLVRRIAGKMRCIARIRVRSLSEDEFRRIPCAIFTGHANLCNPIVSLEAPISLVWCRTYSLFAWSFWRCMRGSAQV